MAFRSTSSCATRLAALIGRGLLKPGERLPTMREVAVALRIDLNTVQRAYAELERDGLLTLVRGRGTFVAEAPPRPRRRRKPTEALAAEGGGPGQGPGHRPGRSGQGAARRLKARRHETARFSLSSPSCSSCCHAGSRAACPGQLLRGTDARRRAASQRAKSQTSAHAPPAVRNHPSHPQRHNSQQEASHESHLRPHLRRFHRRRGARLSPACPSPCTIVLALIGVFLGYSVKMAQQWERAVILRLGKLHAVKGPGLFILVPIFDQIAVWIDQRIRTSEFSAEQALTRDTVPVNVDAIVFWMVHDPERAALEIADYNSAVQRMAQTSLREMIGSSPLSALLSERKEADAALKTVIGTKIAEWGVTVNSVEIRDVAIPANLQDAMSRQAQAERERQARVILGQAEEDVAQKFVNAAKLYAQSPEALQLRAMNIIYETTKERGATILMPTSMVDAMNPGAAAFALNMARNDAGRHPHAPRVGNVRAQCREPFLVSWSSPTHSLAQNSAGVRMARAGLGWTLRDLAKRAGSIQIPYRAMRQVAKRYL